MQTAKNNHFLKLCKFWFMGTPSIATDFDKRAYKQVSDIVNYGKNTLELNQKAALQMLADYYFRPGADPMAEMTKLYADFGSQK